MDGLLSATDDDFCYLTTRGRVSGRPHEIEIWFALEGRTLYLLSGGDARCTCCRAAANGLTGYEICGPSRRSRCGSAT